VTITEVIAIIALGLGASFALVTLSGGARSRRH